MNKQTRITLKNVKHAAFASQETHCYEASVYFDGKRVGSVRNDGHGGCDYEDVTDSDGWSAMCQYITTLPPTETDLPAHDGDGNFVMAESLESICGDLVNQFLTDRDLKKLLKSKFVWQKDNGEVFECKRLKEHTVQGMVEVIAKTEPTSKLLNAMPFADAREIYRAI